MTGALQKDETNDRVMFTLPPIRIFKESFCSLLTIIWMKLV